MTIERMREGGRVSGRDGTLEKRFFAVSSLRRDVSKYCTEHRDHMTTNKLGFGAPVPTGGVPFSVYLLLPGTARRQDSHFF